MGDDMDDSEIEDIESVEEKIDFYCNTVDAIYARLNTIYKIVNIDDLKSMHGKILQDLERLDKSILKLDAMAKEMQGAISMARGTLKRNI